MRLEKEKLTRARISDRRIMPTSSIPTNTKRHSLLRSTSVVSSMTLLSRVLGFVRDIIIATLFGAVAGVDAFFVAFKIPNFMRRLFAEGAFSQAFVPILSEYQQTREKDEIRRFISRITGNLGFILLLLTLLAMVSTPLLIRIFAPGFEYGSARFTLAAQMLRITFPYLMLISLTAMMAAVLNTYRSFAAPAFTPVLLNVSLILAAIYLAPHLQQPITALAWGVCIAGFAQLLFLIPFVFRLGLLPCPVIARDDPGVARVIKLMLPALFGVSVVQVNLLLDTVFASFLPVGSVSWLYYSDRLSNFPLGVFGVAVATVVLPELSRKYTQQSSQQFSSTLDWALRIILLVALPAAIGMYLLAGPLLATLLGYGKFTDFDVLNTRLSLMAFTVGIPAFMLIKVLAAGFYARQNIKTPVKIGVIAMLCNIGLNIALIVPMAHAGLALATSIAAYVNAGLLLFLLLQRKLYILKSGWMKFLFQLACANGLLAIWLIWGDQTLGQWLSWGWSSRTMHLIYLIGGGVLVYFVSLFATGVRVIHFWNEGKR